MPANARPLADLATLDQLIESYFAWMEGEVAAGNTARNNLLYYRNQLKPWADTPRTAGGRLGEIGLQDLRVYHLLRGGGAKRAKVQTAKRLFSWAVDQQLVEANPFASIKLPKGGRRKRKLTTAQLAQLLWGCSRRGRKSRRLMHGRSLRWFLCFMRNTFARPLELRELIWAEVIDDGLVQPHLALRKRKAQSRMADGEGKPLLLNRFATKILRRWRARRQPRPEEHVFLNPHAKPWTGNALGQAMRKVCRRIGLNTGEEKSERIVAYSLRHTAASLARKRGIDSFALQQLMGHANIKTTQIYVHPDLEELGAAAEQATAGGRRGRAKEFDDPLVAIVLPWLRGLADPSAASKGPPRQAATAALAALVRRDPEAARECRTLLEV